MSVTSGSMISYKTKSEAVYSILRNRIMTNELPAGEPINQDQLAKSIGTSVTPVREALRRLEADGFVRNEAHHGVIVSPVDLGDLENLFSVKSALEILAAEQASANATEAERQNIVELAKPIAVADSSELSEWYANKAFHKAIYQATHNDFLGFTLDSVWERYDRYFNIFHTVVFNDEIAMNEHSAIAAAIASGDARDAAYWMNKHHQHGKLVAPEVVAAEPERG